MITDINKDWFPFGIPHKDLINSRPAVIDGDSFAYIIGYNHQYTEDPEPVWKNVDEFINTILQAVQARYLIGVLNPKQEPNGKEVQNFRATIAKTKLYKGNRGEKPDWYRKWAPVIEQRLIDKWGFKRVESHLEADDVVATIMYHLNKIEGCTPTCCGCDKDLMQIPGQHYNYKSNTPITRTLEQCLIDPDKKRPGLYTQVLMGDSTDAISGLPGCGEKGAAQILSAEGVDAYNAHVAVLYAFTNKLGVDEGIQSFYENYMLCCLRIDKIQLPEGFKLQKYDLDGYAASQLYTPELDELPEFNPELGDDGLFNVEG